jgi:hypothetical protein
LGFSVGAGVWVTAGVDVKPGVAVWVGVPVWVGTLQVTVWSAFSMIWVVFTVGWGVCTRRISGSIPLQAENEVRIPMKMTRNLSLGKKTPLYCKDKLICYPSFQTLNG